MDLNDFASGLGGGLAYGVVGLVLLVAGWYLIDLVTPGRLGELIYEQRNANAALVVASGFVAIGAIVTTAIVSSEDDLADGLLSAGGYGIVGLILLGLSFEVVDRLTPGDLGAIVTEQERHPAVYVTVAAHLAMGAIVAAAIS